MRSAGFVIQRAIALRQETPGAPGEPMLCNERRSPKVGQLSTPARLVVEAARRCLEGVERTDDDIIGLSLGTLCGANDVVERSLRTVHGAGIAEVSASWYATGLPSSTAGVVASLAGLRGPNLTLLGYHAGIDAIIMACRVLRTGGPRRMLAGGFDVPGDAETARLRHAPALGDTTAMLPGIGLLLLAQHEVSSGFAAGIVGWSYGDSEQASHHTLVAAAAELAGRRSLPVIRHVLAAGPADFEYLAASGPMCIVDALASAGENTLHAFIADGPGLRPVCLLVESNGRTTGEIDGDLH